MQFETEIWITLRRRDNFCASIYRQAVLNRSYVGTPSDLSKSNFSLFDFERIICQWKERFDNVKIYIFEDMVTHPNGAIGFYLSKLGILNPENDFDTSVNFNQAFHPDILEFVRRLNYFPLPRRQLISALKQWGKQDPKIMQNERYELLNFANRMEINERYLESDHRIKSTNSIEIKNRDTLFPELTKESEYPTYDGMSQIRFEEICRELRLTNYIG